jgi:hypothetical protein
MLVVNGYTIAPMADLRGADLSEADLRGADLRGADLSEAALRGVDLSEAALRGANLRWANLRGATLRWANLRGANLSEADLRWANLRGVDLRGADLSEAALRGVDLSEAALREADLRGANLSEADLRGANLSEADLRGANLSEADLRGVKGCPPIPWTIIAGQGDLIVYKKLEEGVATLKIPAAAKRSNATTRKCRAEFAIVIQLPEGCSVGHSQHDPTFTYMVGETVRPSQPFNDDRWNECAPGIHFFITREEAENY